jgi:putative endonuclease
MSKISAEAESAAADWLAARGWRIVERNWRMPCGEVDIIASRGDTAAFVEVKLAADGSATMPLEKLDRTKKRKIASAAALWLASSGFEGYSRFDVAIVRGTAGRLSVDYFEDAFRAEGHYTV